MFVFGYASNQHQLQDLGACGGFSRNCAATASQIMTFCSFGEFVSHVTTGVKKHPSLAQLLLDILMFLVLISISHKIFALLTAKAF